MLKRFKFLLPFFGHAGKRLNTKTEVNFKNLGCHKLDNKALLQISQKVKPIRKRYLIS